MKALSATRRLLKILDLSLSCSDNSRRLKKICFLLFIPLVILQAAFAQDSCGLRITLLTCSPGEELYSTFGHTALRVQERATGLDAVYNYGTFEFTPDFYSKFIRGKLLYSLSVENFQDFLYTYQLESRSIVEQDLQLSCTEKEKLYKALQVNALEQNRYYRYDFLFDNCTTRARDIVAKNTHGPVVFKNILPEETPTFRHLIHSYLNAGKSYWSKLGIDLLLGAKLDQNVTNAQAMFLPEYLLKGFDSATVNGHPLVTPPQQVLKMPALFAKGSLFTPAVVFSLLLVLVVALTFIKSERAAKALRIFDPFLFLILGLAGLLLLFMWFGTDHVVCRNNYNLLWALPTHVVIPFFIHKNANWSRTYFKIVFWLSVLLLIAWFFLPQQLNPSLVPIILLIILRSWFLSKKGYYGTKRNYAPREKTVLS